jgi:hypothetical protein
LFAPKKEEEEENRSERYERREWYRARKSRSKSNKI